MTRPSLNRPCLVLRTDVRETQELERLRLPVAAALPVAGGEPPELDQPRLVRMQLQAELREPVAQIGEEPLGVVSVLEARHVVVGEPREDHVPSRVPPPPLVGPQVKHVVQVDVGKQRRDRRPLRGPLLRALTIPRPR